jgi:enoyl-CoA hydratase/carnithine racemase
MHCRFGARRDRSDPHLVRQVGRKAAFELVALGEPIDAARALQLGMVNRVVPDQELIPQAMLFAEKLAAIAPGSRAETKRLFHEAADLPLPAALERGRDTNRRMRSFQKVSR